VKWLALALCAMGAGCGYRFTAGGANLPEGIKALCVPVYANRTPEPGVEVQFTSAMRDWTVRSGTAAGRECDGTLEGEIVGLGGSQGILTGGPTPASYRLTATLKLRLVKAGRTVTAVEVSATEDYLPAQQATATVAQAGDVLDTESNRKAAIYRLAQTLAREGYERIASGW
jgi:hypothetical protein